MFVIVLYLLLCYVCYCFMFVVVLCLLLSVKGLKMNMSYNYNLVHKCIKWSFKIKIITTMCCFSVYLLYVYSQSLILVSPQTHIDDQ